MMVRVINGVVATAVLLFVGHVIQPVPGTLRAAGPSGTAAISGLPTQITVVVTAGEFMAPAEGAGMPAVPVTPRTTTPVATSVVTVAAPSPGLLPAPGWASWPSWRITDQGVPFYAGHPACSVEQAQVIAGQFATVGASVDTQRWSIYVASRESGCDYTAVNIGPTDDSHGTHQLNARTNGPLSSGGVLGRLGWTPVLVTASLSSSAAAAAALWAVCAKGPWVAGDYSCRPPLE